MTPRLLTAAEVAELLRVSKNTVYRLARSNRLPWVRIGESVRFRPDDVEGFVERNRQDGAQPRAVRNAR